MGSTANMLRAGVALTTITAALLAAPALAQAVAGQAAASEPTAPQPATPLQQSSGTAGAPATVADALDAGDIVVTAQKRAERLQDVPLSVVAIGGDTLAAKGINDTSSLVQAVPSLTFQQGANPSNTNIRVRGIGTALFSQGVESSVSVVIDGVVTARQAQAFTDLADIERIEVLSGPQGTLFGRNATAGVLNIVTARPSDRFEGRGDVTIAEGDEYRAKGTVSGPLSDTLRGRLTGYYNNVGGIVQNVATGRDVNDLKSFGIRGKLDWDATSNLNFLLIADYNRNRSTCCASVPISLVNPVVANLTAPVVASPTNRQISDDTETYAHSQQKTISLQGDWKLDGATITSITAYQQYDLDVNQPIDRIDSNPIRFIGSAATFASYPQNGGYVHLRNLTQELRIGSSGNQRLTYTLGAYFSHLEIDRYYVQRRAICPTGVLYAVCANPIFQSSQSYANLLSNSISGFGQLEYNIVGGLKAIGGFRLQHDFLSLAGARVSPFVTGDVLFPGRAPISGRNAAQDTSLTGKGGLQYEFNRNAQVYGTYTRGYKGLGYDTEISAAFGAQTVVRPEYVNAYEIGFKGRTSDGLLSVSTALFLANYTDLQVQANRSDPNTGIVAFVTTNAGASKTRGVEIEATLRPTRTVSLNGALTYAKATVSIDGLNCPLQFQAAAPTLTGNFPINSCFRSATVINGTTIVSGPLQNVRGGDLPASPRLRISFSPRIDQPLTDTLAGLAQVDLSYQTKQNFALEQDPLLEQPAYTIVNLTLGVHAIDNRWSASIFVKNLFNQNYFTSIGHNTLLATTANPLDLIATYNKDATRYVGGTFGFKF